MTHKVASRFRWWLISWLILAGAARAGHAEEHAPMFPTWGVGAPAEEDERDDSWMALPRLQPVWERSGLGRREGVAIADSYITVNDSGDQLVALDATTGRDRWQTELTPPAKGFVSLTAAGANVVVTHRSKYQTPLAVMQVAANTGHVRWTVEVECARPHVQATRARLFLICQPQRKQHTLIELDDKTGRELARFAPSAEFELLPNGDLCTTTEDEVRCERVTGTKRVVRWRRHVPRGSRPGLLGTAHFLLRKSDGALQVLRPSDGRLLAKYPSPIFPRVDGAGDRLLIYQDEALDIRRLSDGGRVTRIKMPISSTHDVLGGVRRRLLFPRYQDYSQTLLLTDDAHPQLLNSSLLGAWPQAVIGDVLLAQWNAWRDESPSHLTAYSLSAFAPPAQQLDGRAQVRAIVEHDGSAHSAVESLWLLGRVPHGFDHLEQLVRGESGALGRFAIHLAGRSRDPRLVTALHGVLDSVPLVPLPAESRGHMQAAAHALSNIDSPDAAEALLEFWRPAQAQLAPGSWKEDLREEVLVSAWRYSATRDRSLCPDRQFSMEKASPDAPLGTAAPGMAGVLPQQGPWAVLCQARTDDDGDGRLGVQVHGDGVTGDTLRPYLIFGAGPGTEISSVLSVDRSARHVAISMDTCLYVVDTQTGQANALARGDGRWRMDGLRPYAPASFSLDGRWLAYVRSDGAWSQVVLRDLDNGVEHTIDPGPGQLAGIDFGNDRQSLVMYVWEGLTAETTETWIKSQAIREPCPSNSPLRRLARLRQAPTLHKRIVPVLGGMIVEAGPDFEPQSLPRIDSEVELHPSTPPGGPLPTGPFRLIPRKR